MFVESEKINNIKSFLNNSFGEILIDTERKIFHNRNFIADKVDSSYFNLISGKLIYIKNENTFIDNKVLEKITYIKECKARNKIILSGELEIDYPDVSCNYYIYDLETEEIFNLFNFKNLFDLISFEDNIIFGTKQEIVLYSFSQKFNPLWHFNIQNIPNQQPDWKVKKIIGVLENKLWVALNHHTIVALDIQTGALLHQLCDIPNFQCAWLPSAIPEPEATQIDEKNNKLIGFMWEFYWEINPTNGEIQFWDLSEEFLSQKIRNDVSKFVLTDEKIYFVSHFDSKIASFDRKTKKIEWFYHFEKENEKTPRIMEIQGNDQKIGALSSAGTLYIFEKEEISL